MSEVGISKTMFAAGLVIAVLASSIISTVVSTQWVMIQGPKGDTGDVGPQGEQGLTGLQGTQGSQGVQGEQGLNGSQGPQGIQGETGLQGPQGEQGIQGPPCVFTIENMSGWLPTPAYDSGWVNFSPSGVNLVLEHGLNTIDVLVGFSTNSTYAGISEGGAVYSGFQARWCDLTDTEITIHKINGDPWDTFRVRLWRIAEP